MAENRRTERDLVMDLKKLREEIERVDAEMRGLREKEMRAESALIELLEANSAEATAHYEGVGHFKLMKPRLYANVTKDNQEKLFAYLDQIGRQDLVKTTVAPQTLSTFVKEQIEAGAEVPEFIGYYLKSSLRLFA